MGGFTAMPWWAVFLAASYPYLWGASRRALTHRCEDTMSAKTQLQGIHQGELPMLKPILQKWIDLNRNLANEFILDRDVPWWYNERPHVGLLAGAIWQSGGWAFQEYGIERQIK